MLKLYSRVKLVKFLHKTVYFKLFFFKLLALNTSSTPIIAFPNKFLQMQKKNKISYSFFKYYYNNRPRINTYKPTYFLTFGLLKDYWDLLSRNITKANTKFLALFFRKYILTPYYLIFFNYFTKHSIYFTRLLFKLYKFNVFFINHPHHYNYFYKYKKYRSIKKWVKKKILRQTSTPSY